MSKIVRRPAVLSKANMKLLKQSRIALIRDRSRTWMIHKLGGRTREDISKLMENERQSHKLIEAAKQETIDNLREVLRGILQEMQRGAELLQNNPWLQAQAGGTAAEPEGQQ